MKCNRCEAEIKIGEERNHLGQIICEDCYMEVLSLVRTCDPWATHSANSLEKHSGKAGLLTPIQSKILHILKETGGVNQQDLVNRLDGQITPIEIERELAALRHMEKIGGKRKNERVVWCLSGR